MESSPRHRIRPSCDGRANRPACRSIAAPAPSAPKGRCVAVGIPADAGAYLHLAMGSLMKHTPVGGLDELEQYLQVAPS